MIARESVRRRLEEREHGISFTEFSYQLLQAYDFAHLYATHGCRLQAGGSDQWGNITAGIDLTRRLHGGQVYGLVWPLVERSDGRKFSKSTGEAVWLDADLTSPYAFYQWFFNVPDADAGALPAPVHLPAPPRHRRAARRSSSATRRPAPRSAPWPKRPPASSTARTGLQAALRASRVLFGDEPFAGLDDRTLADAFESAPSRRPPPRPPRSRHRTGRPDGRDRGRPLPRRGPAPGRAGRGQRQQPPRRRRPRPAWGPATWPAPPPSCCGSARSATSWPASPEALRPPALWINTRAARARPATLRAQ